MNFIGEGDPGIPVVLGTRPARHRGRLASDHRQPVYVEANGYLYPAHGAQGLGQGVHRSASISGGERRSPTIIITNNQREEHSPVRPRPRSAHYAEYEDDEWEDRRHRSRGRHHRHQSRSQSPPPPDPPPDPAIAAQLRRLHDLEEKEREEEQRKRFEEEEALRRLKEVEKKKKEEEMKKAAIEEYNAKELEKAVKARKEKEENEKEFRERVKATFGKAGYSDESIERILENKGKEGHKEPKKIMDLSRPTYIKVHRKHLSPDTLDAYELPWDIDERDGNYIIIKRWIPEHEQDILFEHTRKLRESRPLRLTDTPHHVKKEHDTLYLVRKKSPGRRRSVSRSWMFT
ncbi:hypothetical protein MMC07_007368 [Pseudocyphellaria aurata]|nr:hypothetical protein [Pseudocyphellaria aurata]